MLCMILDCFLELKKKNWKYKKHLKKLQRTLLWWWGKLNMVFILDNINAKFLEYFNLWLDAETVEIMSGFMFWDSKITADSDWRHEIKRHLLLGRKVMTNLDSIVKSRDITLPTMVCLIRLWFFQWSCMDVRVRWWRKLSAEELMLLNYGVREESPLDCREIQPVHPKVYQSWVFIGRTDADAESPILWPPNAKSWLTGKDPNAGKDWGQEEKGTTEDEMPGWHHRLDGHGFV